ncbi:MAG: hypothetical protein MUE50_15000 [Pirellulaceae bacterium]|nr:hypothetical protein [Pirellulaceae bacterium]
MDSLVGMAILGVILWWFYRSGKRGAAKATTSADRVPAVAAESRHARNIVVEHSHDRARAAPWGGMGGRFFLAIGDDTPFGNAITRSCQPRNLSSYRSSRVCKTTPVRKPTRAKPCLTADVDDSAKQLEN